MKELLLLVLAAGLEVGGDALIRSGLTAKAVVLMVAGAVVLVGYGFMVNTTRLDFSRLMGLYIVMFFLVAQVTAVLLFRERVAPPVLAGGLLIVAGGIVMTIWR